MNLLSQLPPRMACLTCFSPGSFERRVSKRNGIYFVCTLCSLRLFVNNDVHVFGLLFWSKALSDAATLGAARTDLEAALAQRGATPLPVRGPVALDASAAQVIGTPTPMQEVTP